MQRLWAVAQVARCGQVLDLVSHHGNKPGNLTGRMLLVKHITPPLIVFFFTFLLLNILRIVYQSALELLVCMFLHPEQSRLASCLHAKLG